MIQDFADPATADFYHGIHSKASRKIPGQILAVAHRKLDMLNAAQDLRDLSIPPANRLEALKGEWKGFHSIRINDQFRVIFKWSEGHAYQVQIVDYH